MQDVCFLSCIASEPLLLKAQSMNTSRGQIALSFLAQAASFRQCSISTENRIAIVCERLLIEASEAGYLKKIRINQEDIDLRRGKTSKRRGSTKQSFLWPGHLFYCLAGYCEVTVDDDPTGEYFALCPGQIAKILPSAFLSFYHSDYGFCPKEELRAEAFDEIRMSYALVCELLAEEINPPNKGSNGGRKEKRSEFQTECLELLKTMSFDEVDTLMMNDRNDAWAYYDSKVRKWQLGDARRTNRGEVERIRREKKSRIDS